MAKKKPTKRRATKKPAEDTNQIAARVLDTVTKADSIRETIQILGRKARPKDVIKALADKGVSVSSSQVSTMMKNKAKANGRHNGHGDVNLEHLIAAKNLVAKVGGMESAKTAINALASLLN